MIKRRVALMSLAGLPLFLRGFESASAASKEAEVVGSPLRGSLDAGKHGLLPQASGNQSRKLQSIIDKASAAGVPVFLPPGAYRVSNITLPAGAHLTGVPGASRLIYSGEGFLLAADEAAAITLSNLSIDGVNGWMEGENAALIHLRGVRDVVIDNCAVAGARGSAIVLERCGGRIERSHLSGATQYGLYAVESRGLSIVGNTVADCGNGGLLVHRWTKGTDGTLISGNRIERIRATAGGTGQNGNGINLFRADSVSVTNNHISDCAFSAIRANASSNAIISGNHCLNVGETSIYAEFGFEGAVISANIVDGAANGIAVVNLNEGGRISTVSGNVVRNLSSVGPYPAENAGFGIGISVEGDAAISGNMIENCANWAMQLGWGPYLRNVSVTGNVIRKAPVGIAVSVAEGAGATLIANNLLSETAQGAILGFRWKDKATGELANGPSGFQHLSISGNRTD